MKRAQFYLCRKGAAIFITFLYLLLPPAATVGADHIPVPGVVTIAGSFQSELGCSGDWQPDCPVTHLTYDSADDLWQAAFDIPSGRWEYKAVLDGAWAENYGAKAMLNGPNIHLTLSEAARVKFYFDHKTHWLTSSANGLIANVAGSFQSELGCPEDWQPDCLRSWLQDPEGDGLYRFKTTAIPAGTYEAKVTHNESWQVNYGAAGAPEGANIRFEVVEGATVTFSYEPNQHLLTISAVAPATPDPVDAGLVQPSLQHPFQDQVLYFLLPDRFNNGSALNNCGAYSGDCVNNDSQANVLQHGYLPTDKGYYHGGDLKGLREKLPYLRNLGVTAIWVGPIFKNRAVQADGANLYGHSSGYHGYWVVDFKSVDPHLGTNQEFKELVEAAHSQGLQIFMDIITNHTADIIQYQENDDRYQSKANAPYRDINGNAFDDRAFVYAGQPDYTFPGLDLNSFPYTPVVPEGEVRAKNPDWLNDPLLYHNRGNSAFIGESSLYGDFFGLDDLFTERKEVVEGMIEIYKYWISEFKVDGFRIDTTKHVNLEFWQSFGPAILEAARAEGITHFFAFGEVFDQQYGPSFLSEFFTRGRLQAALDFGFQAAARDFASRSGPATNLKRFFEGDDYFTDADSNVYIMPTFLGNHDIGRIGFFLKQDNPNASEAELLARSELAHALMFFARGQPVIYYGDEQGFTGDGADKDARQDMFPSQVRSYNDDDLIGTEATTAQASFDEGHPLYQALRSYAGLYQQHPALRRGAQIQRYSAEGPGLYAFSRVDRAEKIEYIVAFNNDPQHEQTANIPTFYPAQAPFELIAARPESPPEQRPESPPEAPQEPVEGLVEGPVEWRPGAVGQAVTGETGELPVTVPPLSFVIYRATGSIPASEAAPSLSFTSLQSGRQVDLELLNQDGHNLVKRLDLKVEVNAAILAEVTFAVRSGQAGEYQVIGVDNNPPYRIFFPVPPALEGVPLEFKAIVNDLSGHLNSAEVTGITVQSEAADPPNGVTDYTIIHYLRPDGIYGDSGSLDFNNFWGLHLWGEAIAPAEATEWTAPKPFLGQDGYGRFAFIGLEDPSKDLNFIVHQGDRKDGTEADRKFNPTLSSPRGGGTEGGAGREIWLKADDPNFYTNQAEAQGYVTIYYQRNDSDYGNYSSDNFEDFWGLHLWTAEGDLRSAGDDRSVRTGWTAPKKADGVDGYGAYFVISKADYPGLDFSKPLNFIIHRGETKDTDLDRSFTPVEQAAIWLKQATETIYPSQGAAENYVLLHYHRADGAYGNPASDNFADFWGVHLWDGAAAPNPSWQQPLKPAGQDSFGIFFKIPLAEGASSLAYILHRGETKDPGPDQRLELARYGHEVWQSQGADPEAPYVYPLAGANPGSSDLGKARAHWLSQDTLAWDITPQPGQSYALHYAPNGGLALKQGQVAGGQSLPLTLAPSGLPQALKTRFPHLAHFAAFKLNAVDLSQIPQLLQGQLAVSATGADGVVSDATGLQLPGVLDDLYTYEGTLGLSYNGNIPTLRLWAPTAKSVKLHLFEEATSATAGEVLPPPPPSLFPPVAGGLGGVGVAAQIIEMTPGEQGTWSAVGEAAWTGQYYLYEVEVYVPSTGRVEHNLVTDPYSVGLSTNSERSLILNLDDPALKPEGWDALSKPTLAAPEDIVLYELHLRDFSINDPTVPEAEQGTFRAFTHLESNGMTHLKNLAGAGLTHLHLLPLFDLATINENRAEQRQPDILADAPTDSEAPQAAISAVKDQDGFNWGYDPYHYSVPEGSYATNPEGAARVLEFREMVKALNESGLRVVMDVVYNHTTASGQEAKSVLDKIVPGYYHRLNSEGGIEMSTCCQNTATEHAMMEKLMLDSLLTWARAYKVDGFRFDLMGHHLKSNMEKARDTLQTLTLANDGVDGSKIYLYGEGWNFGEVADNARGVNATQRNMAGTGVGTFNDRLRDAVRGGGPFDGGQSLIFNQGFANGLFYDPNELAASNIPAAEQETRLLLAADHIRVGLAGNLADYSFVDRHGNTVTGAEVNYNGSPAGYTQDPQEQIIYISAHDNQTLYDINQYKIPAGRPMAERVRVQNLGLSLVALAQGIPFFHAGDEMLRSKSLDRDSYNSGDWFNRLDFSYASNNWGAGLPLAEVNGDNWALMRPLLADPALKPTQTNILQSVTHLQEMLAIRKSSPLFRLGTKQEIFDRLTFYNTGPSQLRGLIVMSLSDKVGPNLDPTYAALVVLFNANSQAQTFADPAFAGLSLQLHPIQAASADPVVKTSVFDSSSGAFTLPARTTAVFVEME